MAGLPLTWTRKASLARKPPPTFVPESSQGNPNSKVLSKDSEMLLLKLGAGKKSLTGQNSTKKSRPAKDGSLLFLLVQVAALPRLSSSPPSQNADATDAEENER